MKKDMINLPNYTQIPNQFLDAMSKYSHATKAVFLAICRKTIGWHKMSDRIAQSQIVEMTGVHRNSIRTSIKTLVDDGWITQKRVKNGYVYDLNIITNTPNGVQAPKLAQPLCTTSTTIVRIKEKKEIYINIEHAFCNAFRKKTKEAGEEEEYRIHYAKDRKLLKPLITKYGEDKILKLIDVWFRDDFGEKCGYTIGGFSSCFNKLLMKPAQKAKEKDTRKTLNEMEALRQDKKLHPEKYKVPKEK